MEAAGYLTINPNRTIELTEKGNNIARYRIERNDVIFGLLTDIGVDKETAEADAGKIAHGISEKTLDALTDLRHYLTFIRQTPFGKHQVALELRILCNRGTAHETTFMVVS